VHIRKFENIFGNPRLSFLTAFREGNSVFASGVSKGYPVYFEPVRRGNATFITGCVTHTRTASIRFRIKRKTERSASEVPSRRAPFDLLDTILPKYLERIDLRNGKKRLLFLLDCESQEQGEKIRAKIYGSMAQYIMQILARAEARGIDFRARGKIFFQTLELNRAPALTLQALAHVILLMRFSFCFLQAKIGERLGRIIPHHFFFLSSTSRLISLSGPV
jgi:hypothetical protein